MKEKMFPLAYLATAALLLRGLYALTQVQKKWKASYVIFKSGIGLVLSTDLAVPFSNPKHRGS
jgi:hypothetical protein